MPSVCFHVEQRPAVRVFVNLRTRKRFEIVPDVGGGLLCCAETQREQENYEHSGWPHRLLTSESTPIMHAMYDQGASFLLKPGDYATLRHWFAVQPLRAKTLLRPDRRDPIRQHGVQGQVLAIRASVMSRKFANQV